jgi:hypothetical protein
MNRIFCCLFLALAALSATADDDAVIPGDLIPAGYEVAERHAFNLGATSGHYTDWKRYDMKGFVGFATVLEVAQIYGKPKDKWAALARINMSSEEGPESQTMSLIFQADHKTKRIHALLKQGEKLERFDIDFAVGTPVTVALTLNADDNATLKIGSSEFNLPLNFEVRHFGLIGSGLDVTFAPFVLLRSQERSVQ